MVAAARFLCLEGACEGVILMQLTTQLAGVLS